MGYEGHYFSPPGTKMSWRETETIIRQELCKLKDYENSRTQKPKVAFLTRQELVINSATKYLLDMKYYYQGIFFSLSFFTKNWNLQNDKPELPY